MNLDVRKAGWDQTGKGFSLGPKNTCPKDIEGGQSRMLSFSLPFLWGTWAVCMLHFYPCRVICSSSPKASTCVPLGVSMMPNRTVILHDSMPYCSALLGKESLSRSLIVWDIIFMDLTPGDEEMDSPVQH